MPTLSYQILTVDEIASVMDEVVEKFLIPRFNELNMNASGDWLRSLGSEAEPNKGIIKGLDYTEYLTKGRKPGGKPPISALEKWVQEKMGISGQKGKSVAFAIANKISKKGTSWYEKGGSNLLEVLEEKQTLDFVYMKLGALATPRIAEQLLRQLENR